MKTNSPFGRSLRNRVFLGQTMVILALWSASVSIRAELPAPDNVLYGTITLDGQQVTTNQPTVVVEARRTITGQPVATGGVGAGNLYTLRLPIEAMAPLRDARASLAGDTLFIVVRDTTGVREQTTYQIPEPGHIARIDFGGSVLDSDGDGLPDAWELAMFGGLAFNGIADSDGDGASNLSEFLAGTHPANSNDVFRVAVTLGQAPASRSLPDRRRVPARKAACGVIRWRAPRIFRWLHGFPWAASPISRRRIKR